MQPHPRYDIIEQIAVGDFATVYRARDKDLNREVAIKQIHPQFLADQRQLERYWQEAQLLASLEHPNIMTIYDIDRGRGWLILELMTGSISDRAAGQPMDLDFLRVGLVCTLQALKFLHGNDIIHGDVKPSNLLIDRRSWVKLGDFGLAQRAANDQGSLFKGTTRYIAPERVSDQFGPVGPASDLYSLGFSAYELMCGSHFDTLFPGLGAFGRDQQIAWMMWHAAADRQAPEIGRVLEGVPDELQQVVQRLIAKDPNDRYASADEAIRDLKAGMGLGSAGPTEAELAAAAAAEAAAKKKKRRIWLAISACVGLLFCLSILLIPEPPKPKRRILKPIVGVVKHVRAEESSIVLAAKEAGAVDPTVKLRKGDQLYLNDTTVDLDALAKGDKLRVAISRDDTGKPFQMIHASRPQQHRGTVRSVDASKGIFYFQYTAADNTVHEIPIVLRADTSFRLNNMARTGDAPLDVTELKPGDRVELNHDAEDDHRVAVRISVTRVVSDQGTIRGVDAERNTLSMTTKVDGTMTTLTLQLSSTCKIVINGREFVDDQRLAAADLRRGDKVTVDHDTHVVRVVANRILTGIGVIRRTFPNSRMIEFEADGESDALPYTLTDDCPLTLGGESVTVEALQPGDQAEITYDAVDSDKPIAHKISATRASDRALWALVIGGRNYDDPALSAIDHVGADILLVRNALVNRYRVAPDQLLVLEDVVRSEMKESVVNYLTRLRDNSKLLVYVAAHAYIDGNKTPYLAPKDFSLLNIRESGIPLRWLIDELESCAADDKLLLLDTSHPGSGVDLRQQPSSQELILTLESDRADPALRTVAVLASCTAGQTGTVMRGQGQFARVIANAYSGRADENDDRRVTTPELFEFANAALRQSTDGRQVPALVLPDEITPPRLSEEAKDALRGMALALDDDNIDLTSISALAAKVEELSPDQFEPRILYGLAQLKAGQHQPAYTTFRKAREQFPQQSLPIEGMIWALFKQRNYRQTITGLVRLASRVSLKVGSEGQVPVETRHTLLWLGRLREYAATAAATNRPDATELEKVDQAVAARGRLAQRLYEEGRLAVRKQVEAIDAQINSATERVDKLRLQKFVRPRLSNYVSYSIASAAQRALANIDAP